MRWIWLLLCALVAGCAFVSEGDLAAWQGAPTWDLQTHPLFSAMPKSVERFSDGSQLWTYSNCETRQRAQVCNVIGSTVICNGGGAEQVCCQNQFLVQGSYVAWHRASGHCSTDCSTRPATRPCQ